MTDFNQPAPIQPPQARCRSSTLARASTRPIAATPSSVPGEGPYVFDVPTPNASAPTTTTTPPPRRRRHHLRRTGPACNSRRGRRQLDGPSGKLERSSPRLGVAVRALEDRRRTTTRTSGAKNTDCGWKPSGEYVRDATATTSPSELSSGPPWNCEPTGASCCKPSADTSATKPCVIGCAGRTQTRDGEHAVADLRRRIGCRPRQRRQARPSRTYNSARSCAGSHVNTVAGRSGPRLVCAM